MLDSRSLATTTPAPPGHVAAVINTAARSGAIAADAVEATFIGRGVGTVDVRRVASGGELADALRDAAATRPDRVVVGGGDGSVGCAASILAGTDQVLGVLPLGTANDFARTLEIPTELSRAIDVLLDGKVVDVDLGRANGRVFLNVASMGLSVATTRRLTPGLKRRLGRFAYPVATGLAYRDHRPFSATLTLADGSELHLDDLLQVAVGNGRHYGGGLTVSPTASLDDHQLDVYAIEQGTLRDHVSIARLLRTGHLIEHERVHHLTTRQVRVETDRPLAVNLDGEIAGDGPVSFEVERNALHVVVPQHSTAATYDG